MAASRLRSCGAMATETADGKAHDEIGAIAGGAALSLLGRVVNGALVLAYGIVLARFLDLKSVGIVMLSLTVIKLMEIVARLGLELGALHYVAIAEGEGKPGRVRGTVRSAVWLAGFASFILAVCVALGAPLIARWFDLPELEAVLRILAWSLPPSSVTMIFLAALLGLRQVRLNTIGEKLALPSINLAACSLLLAAGFGASGAGIAYVVAAILTAPLVARFFYVSAGASMADEPPVPASVLLRFSIPLLFASIFNQALMWIDTLMLGLLRSADDVGIYSAATRIALCAGMVVGSINVIFAPRISDLYNRKELAQLEMLYKIVGKWIFLVSLPIAFVMILLPRQLMLLFGPGFVDGGGALVVLALTQLIGSGTGAVGFMLTMSGHQRLMLLNTVAACVLNVGLNALLIPAFGITGAALATCISIAAYNLAALLQVRWLIGMHPYSTDYLRVLAAGLLALALSALLKACLDEMMFLQEIVFHAAVFSSLYFGFLCLFGFTEADRPVFLILKTKVLGRR